MGTETFNYRRPENGSAPNAALAHTVGGDPVFKEGPINSHGPGIQQAGLFSTAPYKPPKPKTTEEVLSAPRDSKRYGMCYAKGDTCSGRAGEHPSGLCAGHRKMMAKTGKVD